MGRDDSWPATVPSVAPTGDCSHWSIHYIHQVNRPISVWMGEMPTQKHPKWWNCTSDHEDSESGSPVSYSSFLITTRLSRLVSEIFPCDKHTDRQTDRETDNVDHYYSWPPHCGGPTNNMMHFSKVRAVSYQHKSTATKYVRRWSQLQ